MTAEGDGAEVRWQERRLLVQSTAAAHATQASLQERLQKAQQAMAELAVWWQGKPRLTERTQIEEAIKAVLKQFRVQGLLQMQIQEHVHQRPVRAYWGRLSEERRELTFTLTSESVETTIARTMSQLGWRVYATNYPMDRLTLEQAVEAYRDEYLVECNFAHLKGHPLSLAPLYVQRDDLSRRTGALAHPRLARSERAGRRGTSERGTRRRTAQPTAERLLEAFREVALTVLPAPGFTHRHITPLSLLQQQILALFGFSPAVYLGLADDS